ncbi:NHL repeat-containing protein 2 [Macrosteles quadrilineatus]|uniref:NHL repeat-containing protein 2 n=1 Tax=Macrosteles quadrilineatus TaxID=74068 RepID=UPI0023E2BA81|nr:NHL repeat-containing protein 2 [Macrosteles quadrilineatus]
MEFITDIYECSSTLIEDFNSVEKKIDGDLIKNYIRERTNSNGNKLPKDFHIGLDWINTSKALSFEKELKGKVVVLDFFTYCCINCMHVLPQLKELEHQFKVEDGLVVIGVHSPKFANEHSTANVRAAVERYEITHPVVNDHKEHLWDSLGICCWPTLVVVGPRGELLLYLMGESHENLLKAFVLEAITLFKDQQRISDHSINEIGASKEYKKNEEVLNYPGKVCVIENGSGKLLAVADTGNHKVLVLDQCGNIQYIIGCGVSGLRDGSFEETQFHAPQGLVSIDENTVFVADTENHAIRKIDLKSRRVETVVGDGIQGEDRLGGKEGRAQRISSPWDLVRVSPDILLIAMAGSHQLWAYYLNDTVWWKNKQCKAGVCEAVVGSGKEENRNNSYPMRAGLAQPSGLTVANCRQSAYVADSESSTVRAVNIVDGKVTNVVGGSADPQNLFAFGDKEGCGVDAKLQHPLAVAWSDHKQLLYVADSYNHKIKAIDVSTRNCTTLTGPDLTFNEPGGLCTSENLLYVADTNNHCIKVINLEDNTVKNMELKFGKAEPKEKAFSPSHESSVSLSVSGGRLQLSVVVGVAAGIKPLNETPAAWSLSLPDDWSETESEDGKDELSKHWSLSYPPTPASGNDRVIVRCKLFYCHKDVCAAKQLTFLVNVAFQNTGPADTSHSINYHFSI